MALQAHLKKSWYTTIWFVAESFGKVIKKQIPYVRVAQGYKHEGQHYGLTENLRAAMGTPLLDWPAVLIDLILLLA